MQRLLAIAWLTWKAAFRFRLFLVIAVLLLVSVVGLPLLVKDDGTAQRVHANSADLHVDRHHRPAGFVHALAFLRHAGTRHRGMPDPSRGHQTHRPLADLAGQMARHHVAERGVAGAVRRVCLRLVVLARGPVAGGGTKSFARTGARRARFGEAAKLRGGD